MSDRRKALDNLEWRKCVAEQIPTFADEFKNVRTDRERLELCWNMLRSDDSLCHVVKKLNGEIQKLFDSYSTGVENSLKLNGTSYEEKKYVLPSLAKGSHPKICNGSSLIQLNCSKTQGRYLEAEEQIKAGDVLILEAPYAAVLVRENQTTHCSRCFKLLEETNLPCHSCHVKYCSLFCQGKAWEEYHRDECCLSPLLQMLDISSHLALRLLLVTGAERLLKFLQEEKKLKPQVGKDLSVKDRIPGCTSDGLYPGDYKCVYNLVTNTDLQPNEALVSYAMDSALITEVAFNYIYGHQKLMPTSDALDNRHLDNDPCLINDGITKETMGCLLLHHMQQMPCNIHAVTAVVSVDQHPGSGVSSKEQRRIAAGIYPTASLLNHACDPDVIVSFLGSTLVVRATHNIKPGEEIAHCYGPSASRMTRQVRQSLLKKQYFFTCYCSACKSDKDLEEQQVYGATFSCQKCSSCVVVSRENNKIVGKCQNDKCRMVKDFSSEVEAVKQAQELFSRAVAFLEEGHYHKSALVLKECLEKRQLVLQKYDKDVAQTHDLLARCYATFKDFRQASFHCEQSTESVRRRFGSESVEYAHELHKFSLLLFNGRQVNKARSVIDSAIRLLSIHYGGKYSDVEELQEMKKTLESF